MKCLKKRIGAFGEDLAVHYLQAKGYKILDRNIKISYQEIDIVAEYSGLTIFVEVKTRTSSFYGEADEQLTAKQIRNLKKALGVYLFKNKLNQNNIRLDLLAIDISKPKKIAKIKHYKDIF